MSQNPWQSDQRFVVFSKNYQVKKASFEAHCLASNITHALSPIRMEAPNKKTNKNVIEKSEAIEFEINDEIVKFYEESYKFRKEKKYIEKKRLNKMKEEGVTVEHISGEQVNLESARSSRNAPLDRAGLKREEELKILYGANASIIHLRETKMQMKFDKNFDKYQPIYWPSLPLRIKFN